MKLLDINNNSSKKYNVLLKEKAGWSLNLKNIDTATAKTMLESVNRKMANIKNSHAAHSSEKNPAYTSMLLTKKVLETFINESLAYSSKKAIFEDELGQAQAILAAKDLVDSVQGMIEDVSAMLNEKLPALGDTIRSSIGTEKADPFKASVSSVLTSLLTTMNSSRDSLDSAVRVLSGEEQMDPLAGVTDVPAMDTAELPASDDFSASTAATGGDLPLGRDKRV